MNIPFNQHRCIQKSKRGAIIFTNNKSKDKERNQIRKPDIYRGSLLFKKVGKMAEAGKTNMR